MKVKGFKRDKFQLGKNKLCFVKRFDAFGNSLCIVKRLTLFSVIK